MKRAGMALLNSLWVVFLVLLFGLTLAALGSFQARLSRDAACREKAFEAAQSGLAVVISRLGQDPDWGAR
ncbi:MAG: hypothetical protein AB1758_33845, partial [Candidatus Eremiobacterota bacterium]